MALFEELTTMGHEQVVFCHDKATGLKAIIAIHDTTLGPALGGCRMWDYKSEEDALRDVLRLSRGMTYKNAVSGLNLGGGKSVIIGDPKKLKSEAFFRTFGRFVNSLGGRYITAEDVNIRVNDIETVGLETDFVAGTNSKSGGSGDPSPVTAWGVYHGIRASVQYKLGKSSLKGVRIAVQGCGAVGSHLIEHLTHEGAKVFVADIDAEKVKENVRLYGAEAASLEDIHRLNVDVFAPCALGGFLDDRTIPELKARVVAGAANNQLLDESIHGNMLRERGILYAPDYVINAGGVINVYQELAGYDAKVAKQRAANIYDTLINIYKEADTKGITTNQASGIIAEERIKAVRSMSPLRNTIGNQNWTHNDLLRSR
ncbi:MAG: Glu/Leu/Phe/Val dehydrogenase [Oligoflexus sp.]|nr:Glu/Leu/Phe/Val dehydrogenase [Oligoflexus sp.]